MRATATPRHHSARYSENAGWVHTYWHRLSDAHISVYRAADQGIDVDGNKYAVVCEKHGAILGRDTQREAIADTRQPEFCERCNVHIQRGYYLGD